MRKFLTVISAILAFGLAAIAQAATCPTFAAGSLTYITDLNALSAGCTPTASGLLTVQRAAAAGTVDAITATFSPALTLTDKVLAAVISAGANTSTTPTFAPDSLTAHTITARGGAALVAGDTGPAGFVALLEYNSAGTRWELLNPAKVRGASDVVGVVPNANTTAASANTASAIVARDGSGNFTATTITAALTGSVSGTAASLSGAHVYKGSFTRDLTVATGTQAITGVGFHPDALLVFGNIDGNNATLGMASSTASGTLSFLSSAWYGFTYFILYYASVGNYQSAALNSMDADGFTLGWTKTGTPTGTVTFNFLAMKW